VELTNAEIFNSCKPMEELLTHKLPVKTSLEVARMVQKLNEKLIPIQKVVDGLIKTHGKKNEKTGQFEIKPEDENFPKFSEEYGELMLGTVEVVFKPVKLPPSFEIEPYVVMALAKFITG